MLWATLGLILMYLGTMHYMQHCYMLNMEFHINTVFVLWLNEWIYNVLETIVFLLDIALVIL